VLSGKLKIGAAETLRIRVAVPVPDALVALNVTLKVPAVVGVPDNERGEIVKAYVVLRPGAVWNQARLDKFCKEKLAAHRRPKLWEHLSGDLPRNFLGKVMRRHLREFQGEHHA
jgi:acyl-coenzyme A synthetase/AMP-(fatty) acid ligase